jgi:hypothetical protein
MDPIRDGIQRFLDETYGEGWRVSHYVIATGLERIVDGEVETTDWHHTPPGQPGYVVPGLLLAAQDELIDEEAD